MVEEKGDIIPFDVEGEEKFKPTNSNKILVEEAYKHIEVPPWTQQVTVRAMVTSIILSLVFTFIVCKLNLTTGVIPSLNVAAGLLGFGMLKFWTKLLEKTGFLKQQFTRQENTVIQTFVVAASGIAFSSGTASYILGMSPRMAAESEGGNTPDNVKTLSLGWMIGFNFLVSFVGLFSILALRKIMILDLKLTYPSGTATAYLINSFHTPKGAKLAKKQVGFLFTSFGGSFLWAFFQWFYFDFSATYVGVGMICPYMINVSLLVGAIISWGIMWPLIEAKKGDWYRADLPGNSLHGIQGYRVFIAVATMLGDGLYHVLKMLVIALTDFIPKVAKLKSSKDTSFVAPSGNDNTEIVNYDEQRRVEFFLKDKISLWIALIGYVVFAAISIVVVPVIFHQLKWYHVLVAYVIAPVLAFCNAYGCGLTDWSLASNYGKFAIIIFSTWVGHKGGIIAGLIACGVMMNIVSTASDLMQDLKTGYLTLSSPRAMLISQILGTATGCLMSPLVFWFFYKAYTIGDPQGTYPAPYGLIYRGIAILGVEGLSSLPKNCLALSISFFLAAILINLVQDLLQKYETKYRIYRFIPSPMCMAIPFYLGSYFAVDMCVGSLILFIWNWRNKQHASDFSPALASGLICGDSLWGIPAAILSLAGVAPPICMKFLSAAANARVDTYLAG
ncbi:hypothetical protein JCGZ_24211 [Jatropha curcas]|uniref:Metal-nicotianamine transporter YSL7 n=1 Tax=Jatropha curcas TaxID=180498 RepID=A0A067LFM2_JATCU|nr:hypothetical protein JCGZ_24211 [Jatropha curcas]